MTCELFFWGKNFHEIFYFLQGFESNFKNYIGIQMVPEQKDFLYQEKLVKVTLLNFFRFVQPKSKKNQRLAVKVHIKVNVIVKQAKWQQYSTNICRTYDTQQRNDMKQYKNEGEMGQGYSY